MNVYWIWSMHCEQCEAFAEARVVDLLEDTLLPLTDVWFIQRRVDLIGSIDPADDAPAPVLTKNDDGRVQPLALHSQPTSDLKRKMEDDVKTPTLLLEEGETTDAVNPIAAIDPAIVKDDLDEYAWLAARGLVSRAFDFYLRHSVDADRMDKIVMRQQPDPKRASMKRLKPPRQHGEFRPHEWKDAFTRAREVHY